MENSQPNDKIITAPDITIKNIASDVFNVIKTEGFALMKTYALNSGANAIINRYIVPPLHKSIIINAVWNVALIIIIMLNRFIFSPRLLMLYYIANCASTFYGIDKILSKIESINPIIAIGIPYTLRGIRGYLNKINILIAVEIVGIFFDWNMDIYIYAMIVIVTVHTLSIQYSLFLCQNIYKLMNINTSFRNCVYLYIFENAIVAIIYGFLKPN